MALGHRRNTFCHALRLGAARIIDGGNGDAGGGSVVWTTCGPDKWDSGGGLPAVVGICPEIRAYAAVPLVGLVLLWAIDRVLKHRPAQAIPISVWLTVWCAEIIGLYTHNLVVPLVIWLNVAAGVVWLGRRDWRHMVIWAGLQSSLIVAYIPWLLTRAPSGRRVAPKSVLDWYATSGTAIFYLPCPNCVARMICDGLTLQG